MKNRINDPRAKVSEQLARMRIENSRAGRPSYDTITPAAFIAWQEKHGFTNEDVVKILDISPRSVTNYRTIAVPRVVALACRAVDIESRKPGGRLLIDVYRRDRGEPAPAPAAGPERVL